MSRLGQLLKSDEFIVTSELLPPKGVSLTDPLRKAERLHGFVDAFNVTDSHSATMTQSPVGLANALLRAGTEPIMQLTCRDRNRIALQADILAAATFGIENFLCLSGDDPRAGDHKEAKPVFDLDAISLLKAGSGLAAGKDYGGNDLKDAPSVVLGAALTPGVEDLAKEVGRAEQKEAAGASFFQTQAVFDMATLDRYLARGDHVKVPILLGVFVLRSANMARRMAQLPGVSVPESLVQALESASEPGQMGLEIASNIVREARQRVRGVHIMALGWENRIPEILERARRGPDGRERLTVEIGVSFPQQEIGNDPAAIRDVAQALEDLGYSHILAGDHVLGEDPAKFQGRPGPYTVDFIWHEPFVFFAYLACCTTRIGFISGILILPQRQTALVAKQAAEVDLLSGGRLRLGIGVGWNHFEYEALNESFSDRGRRVEEQFEVLRTLWTQPLVTYKGRWHQIDGMGLNPMPVQRPIPIYTGGNAEAVLKRTARLADGWIVAWNADEAYTPANAVKYIDRLRQHVADAGRAGQVAIQGSISLSRGTPDDWRRTRQEWGEIGLDAIMLGTRGFPGTPADHIAQYKRFKDEVGLG